MNDMASHTSPAVSSVDPAAILVIIITIALLTAIGHALYTWLARRRGAYTANPLMHRPRYIAHGPRGSTGEILGWERTTTGYRLDVIHSGRRDVIAPHAHEIAADLETALSGRTLIHIHPPGNGGDTHATQSKTGRGRNGQYGRVYTSSADVNPEDRARAAEAIHAASSEHFLHQVREQSGEHLRAKARVAERRDD